jgi:hypothetical protein
MHLTGFTDGMHAAAIVTIPAKDGQWFFSISDAPHHVAAIKGSRHLSGSAVRSCQVVFDEDPRRL